MLINKIITGFVVQVFDTEKKRFISQEFISGDGSVFESTDGQTPIESYNLEKYNLGDNAQKEITLPLDMVQPKNS